jgi:transposase
MNICKVVPHHSLTELIALKNKSSDDGQKLRIRAIINIKKGKLLKQVSEELVVSPKSLGVWLGRYNTNGVDGLASNKGGRTEGNPKWDTSIFTALTHKIKTTGGYWSIPAMQKWIEDTYKKSIPEQTVWYHLNKLGFSYKSSRPHPYKGDIERQTSFKKGVSQKQWAE